MKRYRLIVHNSDEQRNWRSCDDTRENLKIGKVYEVDKVEEHSFHTKLWIKGKKYNSVCFEELKRGKK